MSFKINSSLLEKSLSNVITVVRAKSPMPMLENFLIEIKSDKLIISATDHDNSLKTYINIESDINKSIAVNARLFYDVVRALNNIDIEFILQENNQILLSTKKGKYSLSYLRSEDYPKIDELNEDKEEVILNTKITSSEIKKCFEKTAFAISKEEMKPALNGIFLSFDEEGIRTVATDGQRLVNYLNKSIKHLSSANMIVQEKVAAIVNKISDETELDIKCTKTYFAIKTESLEMVSRLIGYTYPDFNSVVPINNDNILEVNTAELHSAVKRMLLFSQGSIRKVKFRILDNNLEISTEDSSNSSRGIENMECLYEGSMFEIGFNGLILNEVLAHCSDLENIMFKFSSGHKAVVIVPAQKLDSEDLTMVIMPIRLNN